MPACAPHGGSVGVTNLGPGVISCLQRKKVTESTCQTHGLLWASHHHDMLLCARVGSVCAGSEGAGCEEAPREGRASKAWVRLKQKRSERSHGVYSVSLWGGCVHRRSPTRVYFDRGKIYQKANLHIFYIIFYAINSDFFFILK